MSEDRLLWLLGGAFREWKKKRTLNQADAAWAGDLDPANYWRKRDGVDLKKQLWSDPYPNVRGMLAADAIERYASNGEMIYPFRRDRLKPSSYELSLGPIVQKEGKEYTLSPLNPQLVIPPNSIVFVAMAEMLVLPHYIAARFDLAIDYIYQGLLLGTGPQVDPGFHGVLSCPLHNISNNEIKLTLGRPFAKIDFEKTTWHETLSSDSKSWLGTVKVEQELYDQPERLVGIDGAQLELFNPNKRWRWPILDYQSGRMRVESSVKDIDEKVDKFFKGVNITSIFAIVGLAISLVVFFFEMADTLDQAREEVSNSEAVVQSLEREQLTILGTQTALQSRVATIEASLLEYDGRQAAAAIAATPSPAP